PPPAASAPQPDLTPFFQTPPPAQELSAEPARQSFRWGLLISVSLAALLIVAGFVTRPYWMPLLFATDPIALRAQDQANLLLITWNHNANQVRNADSASVVILDAGERKQIMLTENEVRTGSL